MADKNWGLTNYGGHQEYYGIILQLFLFEHDDTLIGFYSPPSVCQPCPIDTPITKYIIATLQHYMDYPVSQRAFTIYSNTAYQCSLNSNSLYQINKLLIISQTKDRCTMDSILRFFIQKL